MNRTNGLTCQRIYYITEETIEEYLFDLCNKIQCVFQS